MKKQPTFTLPINFFEDDRIIPTAVHHGPVGELVAIRILSMIYRNGYYLEWTELNRCRLVRTIPSLTLDQLDAIVETLVASGFFDADSFTREGILTSSDIQAQYLRANRRRIKPDTLLPYFLIPIPEKKAKPLKEGELPAPHAETPENPEVIENPEIIETPETPENPEIFENIETPENIATPEVSETIEPLVPSDRPEPLENHIEAIETPEILETHESPAHQAKQKTTHPPLPRSVKLVPIKRKSKKRHRKQRFCRMHLPY